MPTDKLEDFILQHREAFDDEAPAGNLWNRIETAISSNEDDDPLEDFVLVNRGAFDDTTPPPRLESRVFAQLDAQTAAPGASTAVPLVAVPLVAVPTAGPFLCAAHRRRLLPLLGIAASFLLLLAAAFTIGSSRGYRAAERDQVALELERIDPDMAAAEQYYRGEIDARFTSVRQASDDPQLLQDLAAIDEATQEIRASLLEVPVSQRPGLVRKLIETYRTKLDVLERVQQHLPSPAPTESEPTTQTKTNEL